MKYTNDDGSMEEEDDQRQTMTSFNLEKLKKQAQEVHESLQELEEQFQEEEDETYLILSKNWFDRWKVHVSYDEIIQNKPVSKKIGTMQLQNMNSDLLDNQVNECFKYNPLNSHPWNTWLKQNLQEGVDYMIINQQIQNIFSQYYRGTTITRNSIGKSQNKKVQVNLFRFQALLIFPSTINQIAQDNLTQLDKEYLQVDENCNLKEYFGLIQKTVPTFRGHYTNTIRIWRYKNDQDPHKALFQEIKKQVVDLDFNDEHCFDFTGDPILSDENITFKDLQLTDKDLIVIEFQSQFKPWCIRHPSVPVEGKCEGCTQITVLNFPCVCKKVSYCSEKCKTNDERFHLPKCDRLGSDDEQVKSMNIVELSVKGIAGLSNLGNTCFMNSGTQCLSNTYILSKYFITNEYFNEINDDNPLGTNGQLVRKYGSLIKKLWCGDRNVVIPTSFKKAVGQFQPMFKGFQQHDSSELIAFLLDGLHEDLNRVKKKPYVETKDSHNRPDFDVAKESWSNHLARNQSIIVDLMHGQYKSTLRCPTCQQISITFDPFLTVQVGIPNKKMKSIQVKIIKSVVISNSKFINFDETKKILPLNQFVKEFINQEFKEIEEQSELVYFSLLQNEISDPFPKDFIINDVRKNCKRGILIGRILNQRELQISENDRIYLTYVQKANDGFGQQYKRSISAPQLIVIKSNYTLKQIHMEIFKTLYPLFTDQISEEDFNNEEKLQQYYEENIYNKYYNVLYKSQPVYWKACSFCGSKNCQECLVDYNDDIYEDIKNKAQQTDPQVKVDFVLFWMQSPFQSIKPADIYQYYQNQQYKKQMEEEKNNNNDISKITNKNTFNIIEQKVSLQECLKYSEQPEQLAEDNAWYCKICKEHVQAFKTMQIYKASQILIFTLKRFKASHGFFKQKLETYVEFPVNGLDMSEFILNKNRPSDYEIETNNPELFNSQEPLIFDLYAVSNHFGGMGGGHYTAYAKNELNGKWYNFDDSQVSEIEEDQVVTKSAYVLFYKLRKSSLSNTQVLDSPK